jgi:uncharacterized protein
MFELPIFPLNTVLFPGMPLRLHIFEDRYKMMIQRALTTNQTFGVTLIKTGEEAGGPVANPYMTGCTARVVQVEPAANDTFNMTVIGDERFRILRMGLEEPYLTAYVESAPLLSHHSMEVVRGVHVLRKRMARYLAYIGRYLNQNEEGPSAEPELDLTQMQLPEDPMMLIYLSAALLQIPANEKQPLLEVDTLINLLEQVQRLYRRELSLLPSLSTVTEEQARTSAWAN